MPTIYVIYTTAVAHVVVYIYNHNTCVRVKASRKPCVLNMMFVPSLAHSDVVIVGNSVASVLILPAEELPV